MANKNYRTIISWWILLLVIYMDIIIYVFVEGKNSLDENRLLPKARGTVKTIECPEDGDVIDCIDYWEQPGFDNPLTKKLQMMKPARSFPEAFEMRNGSRSPIMFHKWNKYGVCPKGTIPIKRTVKNNDSSIYHRKVLGPDGFEHEYATVHYPRGYYNGAKATINLWEPFVEEHGREFSLAQIWVISGVNDYSKLNTIEAGWMVHPFMHGGSKETKIFTFWTADGYKQARGYNTNGFIVTSSTFSFDCAIRPVSVYGGLQYELKIAMERNPDTGDWYLYVDNEQIGFWPSNLFTTLKNSAEEIRFGGEVINEVRGGAHTFTQMGSGHFPYEGFSKAAYFRNLEFKDGFDSWNELNFHLLQPVVDTPGCYNIQTGWNEREFKTFFFYGGPGGIGCDHPDRKSERKT